VSSSRRWTAVTQLADAAADETIEKYPIDKNLVAMIVAAADRNDAFDFFDAAYCRAKLYDPRRRGAAGPRTPRAVAARPTDSDVLPGAAVADMINDDLAIVVAQVNPKKGRSADRYELYKHAKTTRQFLDLGGSRADLRNDLVRGHVSLPDGADWRELPCVIDACREREELRRRQLPPPETTTTTPAENHPTPDDDRPSGPPRPRSPSSSTELSTSPAPIVVDLTLDD